MGSIGNSPRNSHKTNSDGLKASQNIEEQQTASPFDKIAASTVCETDRVTAKPKSSNDGPYAQSYALKHPDKSTAEEPSAKKLLDEHDRLLIDYSYVMSRWLSEPDDYPFDKHLAPSGGASESGAENAGKAAEDAPPDQTTERTKAAEDGLLAYVGGWCHDDEGYD